MSQAINRTMGSKHIQLADPTSWFYHGYLLESVCSCAYPVHTGYVAHCEYPPTSKPNTSVVSYNTQDLTN